MEDENQAKESQLNLELRSIKQELKT